MYESQGDRRVGKYEDERVLGDRKTIYTILAVTFKHIAFRVIAVKQLPKHARPPALRMIGIYGFGARNDFATLMSSLETSIFVRNQRVAN